MPDSTEQLRQVNERLESFLGGMSNTENDVPTVDSEMFAELMEDILHAGAVLGEDTPESASSQEKRRYHENLERMRGVLPLVEVQLRLQRVRLESEKLHLERAAEWVAAAKPTR